LLYWLVIGWVRLFLLQLLNFRLVGMTNDSNI